MQPPENLPPGSEELGQIFRKIIKHVLGRADGRAVPLDELGREGVLSDQELQFISANPVIYRPRTKAAYLRGQYVLKMDTGCGYVMFKTGGKRIECRGPLREIASVVRRLWVLSESDEDLQLHIKLSEEEGIGIFPGRIIVIARSDSMRERLSAIRDAAAAIGLQIDHDRDSGDSHTLTLTTSRNADEAGPVIIALLSRSFGLSEEDEVTYIAEALDEDD